MLCDFFFRLRVWAIHAKTGLLASQSTIVMNTSVFVFQGILDSTAMVSLSFITYQVLCNQSRHSHVNLCWNWMLVKNLTQNIYNIHSFAFDEVERTWMNRSVFVVNTTVTHFSAVVILPLKFIRRPLKVSMLCFLFFFFFVLFVCLFYQ